MSAQPYIDVMWVNSILGFCLSFVLGTGSPSLIKCYGMNN